MPSLQPGCALSDSGVIRARMIKVNAKSVIVNLSRRCYYVLGPVPSGSRGRSDIHDQRHWKTERSGTMKLGEFFRLLLFLTGAAALAQTPVINPGGVVNAASFAGVTSNGQPLPLVPGGIASLFGENLAAGPVPANVLPLPTTLGGTTVTVNGTMAPLFYVSPLQINFQIPSSTEQTIVSLGAPGVLFIVVTTTAGSSAPVTASVFLNSPGIFTQNGTGCGAGAILNVKPDGSVSLNSPSNSASPGEYLSIFATGLGLAGIQPADGEPAPDKPLLALLQYGAGVQFYINPLDGVPGGPGVGQGASFAGKAPGFVGLDQLNVLIPSGAPQGCNVPLRVGTGPAL
jgi:uncharacterized protein (TIGR03437 family)